VTSSICHSINTQQAFFCFMPFCFSPLFPLCMSLMISFPPCFQFFPFSCFVPFCFSFHISLCMSLMISFPPCFQFSPFSLRFTTQLPQTCSVAMSTVTGALQAASDAAAAFRPGRPGQRAFVNSSMQQQ